MLYETAVEPEINYWQGHLARKSMFVCKIILCVFTVPMFTNIKYLNDFLFLIDYYHLILTTYCTTIL